MIRIYADFNSVDEGGRVWLNTVAALTDIAAYQGALTDGMRVMLYVPGELEVEATLVFDRIWNGIPDWATLHCLDEE